MISYSVILNSCSIRQWQIDAIEEVAKHFQSYPAYCFVVHPENNYFKYNPLLEAYSKWFTLNKKLADGVLASKLTAPVTQTITVEAKGNRLYTELIKKTIAAEKMDFIIDFTSLPVEGNATTVSRWGIWKFKFSDDQVLSDYPPAFDEIRKEKKIGSVHLLALRSDNEYHLLREFCIDMLIFSYRKSVNAMLRRSIEMLVQTITDCTNHVHPERLTEVNFAIRKNPGCFKVLQLILQQAVCFFKFLFIRGLYVDNWNIGFVNKPVETFLDKNETYEVTWIDNLKKNNFIADPFAIQSNGTTHIFFEKLDFSEGVGYINTARLEGDRLTEEKTILKTPYHLSYPFTFEHDGSFYFIPEANESNEISLYQSLEFPGKWQKVKTLVPGFRGIDSTMFFFNGLWWLFSTNRSNNPHAVLYAFYSDSIMGNWQPHKNNPVKIDIRSARGAGMPFYHEGQLYRPAQDYSQEIEGRIRLQKITKLSPTEFFEQEVRIINPFKGTGFPHKTHTLCGAGNITIVDGCRKIIIFKHPWIIFFKIKRIFHFILKYVNK